MGSVDLKPRESEMINEEESEALLEPYVGMEFESEDEAKDFYINYARKLGFVVRLMQRRRSGIDGRRTVARRLGCNKQGFSRNNQTNPDLGTEKRLREGCKATILVKLEKSGKWMVTRFVKEHNHSFNSMDDKDDKIRELMEEVECQDRLCVAYRDKLVSFMKDVEHYTEELSLKIRGIVENIKKLECEMHSYDDHL